MNLLGEGCWW